MSNRPWPPNPRDARPRNSADIAGRLMVTLLLMLVSIVTGVLTEFGDQSRKADAFFMASKKRYEDYNALALEYSAAREDLNAAIEGVDIPKGLAATKELVKWQDALTAAEKDLEDPLVDVKKGQVWRLVTPMFLHFGILHLAFNMMWLWQFGVVLEIRFRSLKFLALVLAVAALSDLAQGFWSGANFGGMSGVNYGLFGFILLRSKLHPAPEFSMNSQTVAWMLIWLVVCFTGTVGPVANAAHLVGFLSGAAIGAGNAIQAGGWQVLRRRRQFRSAMKSSANALHRCATCGKTEHDDASMEFYVSSTDDQEYCQPHLPENRS